MEMELDLDTRQLPDYGRMLASETVPTLTLMHHPKLRRVGERVVCRHPRLRRAQNLTLEEIVAARAECGSVNGMWRQLRVSEKSLKLRMSAPGLLNRTFKTGN